MAAASTVSHRVTKDIHRLHRLLGRLERRLPARIALPIRWLRAPSSRWLRIPAGVLLVLGGIFSFLPLLGLWMLPLGLLLLAQDLPFLRRPTRRTMILLERRWLRWKRQRRR
ncbi:MAG TPA: hypothetical protein VGU65_07680 [Frateuria sp.]|uniref:hypothetical protein n=1 Tax=Frateuria sp. TaxID=2211372 RepID=UPI002DEE87CE|nr:hypothetical protein [Frateuria sp.]